MYIREYTQKIHDIIDKINQTQTESISKAAQIAAKVIENDGLIYIFGCGHSHLIGLDSFYRAGGLANVSVILDTDLMLHNGAAKSSAMECMEGIAKYIFERYCLTDNDMLFVVSASDKNGVPIEMAQCSVEKGVPTVAITSSEYFGDKPRHSSKTMLHQNADFYIDNCVPHGDACISLSDEKRAMGPLSTYAGSFIMNCVFLKASEICEQKGIDVPVYKSGNIEGGKEYNKALIQKYFPKIKHL